MHSKPDNLEVFIGQKQGNCLVKVQSGECCTLLTLGPPYLGIGLNGAESQLSEEEGGARLHIQVETWGAIAI